MALRVTALSAGDGPIGLSMAPWRGADDRTMRRTLVSLLGTAVVLGMVSSSAVAAETTTDDALPAACQIDASTDSTTPTTVTPTSTSPTVTTSPMTATTSDDATADDDADADGHGSAVSVCVQALRADGQHGFGQIISEFAHAVAEQRREGRHAAHADSTSSDASATT